MTDAKLLAAYQNTDFVVRTDPRKLVLRPGEPNESVDDQLRSYGTIQCAFVTAWECKLKSVAYVTVCFELRIGEHNLMF